MKNSGAGSTSSTSVEGRFRHVVVREDVARSRFGLRDVLELVTTRASRRPTRRRRCSFESCPTGPPTPRRQGSVALDAHARAGWSKIETLKPRRPTSTVGSAPSQSGERMVLATAVGRRPSVDHIRICGGDHRLAPGVSDRLSLPPPCAGRTPGPATAPCRASRRRRTGMPTTWSGRTLDDRSR